MRTGNKGSLASNSNSSVPGGWNLYAVCCSSHDGPGKVQAAWKAPDALTETLLVKLNCHYVPGRTLTETLGGQKHPITNETTLFKNYPFTSDLTVLIIKGNHHNTFRRGAGNKKIIILTGHQKIWT